MILIYILASNETKYSPGLYEPALRYTVIAVGTVAEKILLGKNV